MSRPQIEPDDCSGAKFRYLFHHRNEYPSLHTQRCSIHGRRHHSHSCVTNENIVRRVLLSLARVRFVYLLIFSVLLAGWRRYPQCLEGVAAASAAGEVPEAGAGTEGGEDTVTDKRILRDQNANYYELLGVHQRSTQDEIKRMFRKLAVRMHPDKRGPFESPDAEREANRLFMRILKAYETLTDPVLRANYDTSGMKEDAVERKGEEDMGPSYEDSPFGIYVRFGGGRGGFWFDYKGHGKRQAPHVAVPVQLTFEQAFAGKTERVTVTRERLCRTCGGTGSATPEEMETCPLCAGKGYAYHLFGVQEHNHNDQHASDGKRGGHHCVWTMDGEKQQAGGVDLPGYSHAVNTTCKACRGMGKISDGSCPVCGGRNVNLETETFEVVIPAGALPGHQIRLAGKGHEHPLRLAGDVIVTMEQLPHARFTRSGPDLLYKAEISLIDALVGFERQLTLLDGSRVPITHDQIGLSGFLQQVSHLGFPVVGKHDERGKLIVKFEVKFPTRLREKHLDVLRTVLTAEEIQILEDILRLMSARKAVERYVMDPLEYLYTQQCFSSCDENLDGDKDSDESPVCIPDVLWWARPARPLTEHD